MIHQHRSPRAVLQIAMISLAAAWSFHAPLQGEEKESHAESFVRIFDGKTLDGWEGDPVYWRVEDGHLVGEITPATVVKRNTFIIWKGAQPADFELVLEYRITGEGNSGVNYRSARMEDHPFALTGYQADIDGMNRFTGQNYEERGRTTLARIGEATVIPAMEEPLDAGARSRLVVKNAWSPAVVEKSLGKKEDLVSVIKRGDWNQMRIVAKGSRLLHYVNGVLLSDVTDKDPHLGKRAGFLGMQVHVGPPMKVEFRNIMIRNLAED